MVNGKKDRYIYACFIENKLFFGLRNIMVDSVQKAAHTGFIRRRGFFIFLIFASNIFEIGFGGLTARLPGDGYETFGALYNIFLIIIAPLTSIQLVVSKEISSYNSLGEFGKVKTFVKYAFRYVVFFSLAIMILGLITSRIIAGFLRIDSVMPVIILMLSLGFYTPIPVLCGTIQGLKKFLSLGFVYFNWGFFRFCKQTSNSKRN